MTKSYQYPSLSQLTPYLTVKDADKSLEFYEKAFGFKADSNDHMKDNNGKTLHAHMMFEDAHIMFGPEGAFDAPNKTPTTSNTIPGTGLYVYCADVDAMHKKAVSAGCTSLVEPMETQWGDRMCRVADPDGHQWSFATFKGQS
ncbi:MAG: VOC family protein [bacterium]|nr:VOC family protein [bacterium]